MIYVFLNNLSNNGKGKEAKNELEKLYGADQLKFIDVKEIKNAAEICGSLNSEDKIIL